MRFFSRPASGGHTASALSASHEPPGPSGASTNSQARHRALSASKLPRASQRVAVTRWLQRAECGAGRGAAGDAVMVWWHHIGHVLAFFVVGGGPAHRGAARRSVALSLENHRPDPARALSRGPSGADGQQSDLYHHPGAGAVFHGG